MTVFGLSIPDQPIQAQRPMLRVCYALLPLQAASIYLFGWRSLVGLLLVTLFGLATEALFTFRQGKPVTSAVLVTCLIFHLSLPPTTPFFMAVVGIVAGVALGKMVFGGFGFNVFNPAMVGRCFIYVTFPIQITATWVEPFKGLPGGLAAWSPPVDAVSRATPLALFRTGGDYPLGDLFLGSIPGSLGETSALLIILGGTYIIYKKAAPWRLAVSCLLGGAILNAVLFGFGVRGFPSPLTALMAGSFLFGAFFVVTEPISGAKTKPGQWIYGFLAGALIVALRGFSNFSEGVMFSVLILNAFVPLLDQTVQNLKAARAPQRVEQ